MKLKSNQPKATSEQVVKDIRRATRWYYSKEDKVRIILREPKG
jgi:transposase